MFNEALEITAAWGQIQQTTGAWQKPVEDTKWCLRCC